MGLKWSGKFNFFKRNFGRFFQAGKKPVPVEIVRLNDHRFFLRRFETYVRSKERILKGMGVNRVSAKTVADMMPFVKVGQLAQRGQVVSLPAARRIAAFFHENKELMIDVYSRMMEIDSGVQKPSHKTNPEAMRAVLSTIANLDETVKRQKSPPEDDYNLGVVERVDQLLLSQRKRGGPPIIIPRLSLLLLAEFEEKYLKFLGINFSTYAEEDKRAARDAFGEGKEVLM